MKSCHCCKLLSTKKNNEKVFCVKVNCHKCGDEIVKCTRGYYYHERITSDNDNIVSVSSSMMLSPRETKKETLRRDKMLIIQQSPRKYVLLHVESHHCCKLLHTKETDEKVYCLKIKCHACDNVSQICEVGYYFNERPINETDDIVSVTSCMR